MELVNFTCSYFGLEGEVSNKELVQSFKNINDVKLNIYGEDICILNTKDKYNVNIELVDEYDQEDKSIFSIIGYSVGDSTGSISIEMVNDYGYLTIEGIKSELLNETIYPYDIIKVSIDKVE